MPAKWSRPVFSFRFYEGKISRALGRCCCKLSKRWYSTFTILPPWSESTEIATAIDLARRGLTLLPRDVLERLLDASSPTAEESLRDDGASRVSLTPREHEVLAAMADGASNKVIARRLGISLHTVKFHVAAILAKLDADSRTEAVARAAHLGLVML